MSGLHELIVPADRTEYSSVDELEFALHDWVVKEKFAFRHAKSSGATWHCAHKDIGCQWKVRGERKKRWRAEEEDDDDDDLSCSYTLVIVHSDHYCVGAGTSTHRSSSRMEWLDGVVARHMRVTKDTPPKAIRDML